MENATDAMIDLETLGTDPYAPLLAIGACAFRFDGAPIDDTFYQAITLDSCMELGMRPSAGTIKWWMTDGGVTDVARQASFNNPEAVALPVALDVFTDWLNSRPMKLWGNSARFDMGLLEAAYKACNKVVPWQFWNERCYRTVKGLPAAKGVTLQRVGTHHDALDDAVSQAMHLRAINQQLQLQL